MFSQLSNRTKGLISGSAELREQAAEGLGELVDVTGEQTLKEFVVPITGPLIRIIGDRFPWQVKSAILSTLCIIISKGGVALKPFLPQLQTTFIKCLQDNARTVCSSAALALGKLSALSTRVDPLVSDLLSLLQASDGGTRQAVLVALKCVVKHAGKIVSSPVRSRALTLLKDLIQLEDDHIRSSAGGVLGTLSQPSILCTSTAYPVVVSRLKDALEDDKFPIRETANRALGRLLVYHVQGEAPSAHGPSELIPCLASTLRDDSSEVRRRALSGLKAITKENPSALFPFLTILGPALAECMKDGNTPVRLAAERCALHVFQLTKGSEHVQASQKYITGLDARRISKLPVNSDDSEDGEEDMLR